MAVRAFAGLGFCMALGCAAREKAPPVALAPVAVTAAPLPSAPPLAPPKASEPAAGAGEAAEPPTNEEPARTFALDVPNFEPALVELPSSSEPAPVVLVAHGAGGTAEAHCELWSRISGKKAILLCLRGRRVGPSAGNGSYYPDHHALERECFAALEALNARLGARIAAGPALYAGFSQGATMGSLMLVDHASQVSRLALVEGGSNDWNLERAREFKERGGERVLFVCGRKECAEPARAAARWLTQSGVAARVEYIPGAGHTHDGPVETRLRDAFPWLITGDTRWR